ncbi:anti-sigma factor domain-containing protein [Pseudonocardia xinjiangensis]|uniref:Regulator of SigK n=1 Tax=Pseudonocardia xinjiangensis TaxID=75289 RepID=A0ABX1RJI5_9PSEU|nr:anti-sigma factor [Pseudonocardia xinjiangensis]NMH80109.1 anti-sigma factor [Pseudonocardia xinjiangensis]
MSADEQQSCAMNEHAVGWALHALEPDDELAMEAHLPTCESCREMVRDTELIMGGLADTAEQTDPPPRLRDNILAQAAETPQVRPPAPREREPEDPPRRAPVRPDVGLPAPSDTGARRRPTWATIGRRRLVAAVVVLVAVLGVGGLAVYAAQLQQQRDAEIAQSQSLADIVTQLDQPGTTHATLSTTSGDPVAAVLTTASDRTVVTTGVVPNNRSDSIYVLWGIDGGPPQPVGMFDVTAPGPGVHSIGPAVGAPAFSAYAISLEPGRAMPTMPTTVVATGPVQT